MPPEPDFGAWDEPRHINQNWCVHNFQVASYSNEQVCAACGLREFLPELKAGNIHPSAVVGGPPQWRNKTTRFPVVVVPSATVGPLAQVDAGTERPTIIGRCTQVMGMVHIGHGVQIGAGCDIASGTVIAGEATIRDFVRVGVGAVVAPYITIGRGARVGAGAVVVNDVAEEHVVVGNPAQTLRRLNPAELAWIEQRELEASECE